MIVIWLILIFNDCCNGQTPVAERSVDDIANPLVDLDKCGQKGMQSHVCDPDGLMTVDQASQLSDLIRAIYNETSCQCGQLVCGKDWGGNKIGLVMIKKMKLDVATSVLAPVSGSRDRYHRAVLEEARYFASTLLSTWNMGRCKEDLMIFYSKDDNVLFVATNQKAKLKLEDEFVRDVSRDAAFKLELQLKESIPDAFKIMLGQFKLALTNKFPPTTTMSLCCTDSCSDNYSGLPDAKSEERCDIFGGSLAGGLEIHSALIFLHVIVLIYIC